MHHSDVMLPHCIDLMVRHCVDGIVSFNEITHGLVTGLHKSRSGHGLSVTRTGAKA
jgi:hypothetical protein